MRLAVTLAAAVAIVVLAGCQQENVPDPERLDTFVGKIQNSGSYIALVTKADVLAGYISDGKGLATFLASARIEDGKAALVVRGGSRLGEATLSGDSVSGDLTLGVGRRSFDAVRAGEGAGFFYTADRRGADLVNVGWIVLPDGSQRGTMFSIIDGERRVESAPPLVLADPTVKIPHFGSLTPIELDTRYLERNNQTAASP